MIILLCGEDTYRSRQRLSEIVEEYRAEYKSGFNLSYLEGKEVIFEDLKSLMFEISMFKEKKLYVVYGPSLNRKLKEDLCEKGKIFADCDNTLVLYEAGSLAKNDKLLSFAEKNGKVEQFNALKAAALQDWIREKFIQTDKEFDEEAVKKLAELVGGDLWRLNNEIGKLANKEGKITLKAVESEVRPNLELNIFETVDAIASKDKKRAIKLLKAHEEQGDAPIYLIAMIASQIRNMISVKQAGGNPGMNSFVAMKSSRQAAGFSLEELKRIYARILELDSDIKVGKIEQEVALDILISEI